MSVTLLLISPLTQAMTVITPDVGFHPKGKKTVYIQDVPANIDITGIKVHDPSYVAKWELYTGKTMYKVPEENIHRIELKNTTGPTGKAYMVDISNFQESGDYELHIKTNERTDEFEAVKEIAEISISEYTYWDRIKSIVRRIYFQRRGKTLEGDKDSKFFFYDCYVDESLPLLASDGTDIGKRFSAHGGWYKAGMRNKEVLDNALVTANLMAMSEAAPKPFRYFRLDYPINEKELGAVPDLFIEIKHGLNFILAMQERDGLIHKGVYGINDTCDFDVPLSIKLSTPMKRFVRVGTIDDTAGGVAALAMAGRVLKERDISFAVKYLRAADAGWLAMAKNWGAKEMIGNPWAFWATVELALTTNKDMYHKLVLAQYNSYLQQGSLTDLPADSPLIMALSNYALLAQKDLPLVAVAKKRITDAFNQSAAKLSADVRHAPRTAGLKSNTAFTHGSNDLLTRNGLILLLAYRLNETVPYRDSANTILNYVYGVNPLHKTFLTGNPTEKTEDPVRHMYLPRYLEKLKVYSLDGYFVAGPDNAPTDGKTPAGLGALSYVDNNEATSVNSIKTVYNARFAYFVTLLNNAYNLIKESDKPKKPLTIEEELELL